jgi:hypothetical protein
VSKEGSSGKVEELQKKLVATEIQDNSNAPPRDCSMVKKMTAMEQFVENNEVTDISKMMTEKTAVDKEADAEVEMTNK